MSVKSKARAAARGKVPHEPTYNLTASQLEAMIADAVKKHTANMEQLKNEATERALQMLMAIPVVVLHDKKGYGKQRLNQFLSWVNTWVKAIHQDPDTLAELVEIAQTEADYDLEWVNQ